MFLTSESLDCCRKLPAWCLPFTQALALRRECLNWSLGHSPGTHGIQFFGKVIVRVALEGCINTPGYNLIPPIPQLVSTDSVVEAECKRLEVEDGKARRGGGQENFHSWSSSIAAREPGIGLCPQYQHPTPAAQTLRRVDALSGGIKISPEALLPWILSPEFLVFPTQDWPRNEMEMRKSLSEGQKEKRWTIGEEMWANLSSSEKTKQLNNRNSENKEQREQVKGNYQRNNRNILKIIEISQKR